MKQLIFRPLKMNWCFINSIIIILLFGGVLENAAGLKWVPGNLNSEYKLPENVIYTDDYIAIGRAKSSAGKFVPAEVDTNLLATIKQHDDGNIIPTFKYEILTTSKNDKCKWKPYYHRNHYKDLDETVVRVGLDPKSNDTIYMGRTYVGNGIRHLSSILMPTERVTKRWDDISSDDLDDEQWEYLSCTTKTIWLNASSFKNLPSNAVSAGQSKDGHEMYVARARQQGGSVLTGYVIPSQNASVFDDSLKQDTDYDENYTPSYTTRKIDGYQILVGESNEYEWVEVNDGQIPDYAVVNGIRNLEPIFVAKIDGAVRPIIQSEALRKSLSVKVLIHNEI